MLNIPTKTIGGIQFWTDHHWRGGFRLQQHAISGHWRLLDDKNVRRAWGSKADCLQLLEKLKPKNETVDQSPHVVVLLHGLLRSARCMTTMENSCYQAGFDTVVRFSYASSRRPIGDHAAALQSVLQAFPENAQFSFVGHSMGGIVVRHVIGDLQREDPSAILGRCQSIVMLGPPNQGAAIARRLAPTGLYRVITGKGGWQLGPKWNEFADSLAVPPFPFAIIAGDLSEKRWQNPLIGSSGDYLVTVEEAKLEGSEQFHTLPVIHSRLMKDRRCIDLSVGFIKSKAACAQESQSAAER